jgi:hypothetical protein
MVLCTRMCLCYAVCCWAGIAGIASATDAIEWGTLVDATSPFRLLYALQIVDTLTDVSDMDGDRTVKAVDHAPEKPAGAAAGVCRGRRPRHSVLIVMGAGYHST